MFFSIDNIAWEQEEFIRDTLERVERELHPSVKEDEEMIRKALFAVRNQSIKFHRHNPNYYMLTATVQDVQPAEVRVDFYNGTISCSCPQRGWCRHRLSVLLALYQHIDSVQEWVANWRAKKSIDLKTLSNKRTPESWLRMVDELLNHFLDLGVPSFLFLNVAETALDKLNGQAPYEREWGPIYRLFMEVALLNKFWTQLIKREKEQHVSVFDRDYFKLFLSKHIQSIKAIIVYELPQKSRLFEMDPFFDTIQLMIRELLLEREGYLDQRMKLYLLFWDKVFIEKRRVTEELQYLESLNQITVPEAVNVFYIISKDYEALEESLNHIQLNHLNLYFILAEFAYSRRDERAVELILRTLLPHLKWFKTSFPTYNLSTVYSLYENINLTEEEELTLYSSLGKEGVKPYSFYLLNKGRYEEWVALHQMYPSSIGYLENCGLHQVLEAAPEVTLPLFHFYAMEEVKLKSRQNYKQAVRIWKKMKSAAKKSGKMSFWSDYIQSIRDQYKRLRALQEELEKGNLFV